MKGNKGEWSELYALVYLLGTRKLYAADEKLQKIKEFYFPILKILRSENKSSPNIDYMLKDTYKVEIYLDSTLMRTMTSKEFSDEAKYLHNEIRKGVNSFEIAGAEKFMDKICCGSLTSPSTDVTDIKMELHDSFTGFNQVMGFSVKSYLGDAPTLLNASGVTNFIYEVTGISEEQMNSINTISTRSKIRDRIKEIYACGGKLTYFKLSDDTFSANLMMIDSKMENIIAEMLLYSYREDEKDCSKLINSLEESNPLNYPRKNFYVYKFKKFLCAKALGLEPSREWHGIDEANGGYIVVKLNGDVVAYHLYNRDKFEQYLYDSTCLERASTSRHGYASLYIDSDSKKMYIKLNLQIRFKKLT